MRVETKFLRLFRAVELGDDIDGWKVCWLGGWDKMPRAVRREGKAGDRHAGHEPDLPPPPAVETRSRLPAVVPRTHHVAPAEPPALAYVRPAKKARPTRHDESIHEETEVFSRRSQQLAESPSNRVMERRLHGVAFSV
jgi:hypothetical protein